MNKITLENLGYNDFFAAEWDSLAIANAKIARVIAEHKEAYQVKSADAEYLAKITGKHMFNAQKRADYPAVGDWVVITEIHKNRAVIQHILTRKTILEKKYSNKQDMQIIATNIDFAFIVEALDRDYNLNRFERYLVLANEGGIKPVFILNKVDLVTEAELNEKIEQIKHRFLDIDIVLTSNVSEYGLKDLENYIKSGKTYCFIGSSGVGKSSLINKLLKKNAIKTKEISKSTGKGKHTTTVREMYFLDNGGIVIDSPGTREVGIADSAEGLENIFEEITALAQECKYANCTHTNESGCAILKAIKVQKLDQAKFKNYLKLKKEHDFYQMTDLEKRQKDKKFGKMVKKTLEALKEF